MGPPHLDESVGENVRVEHPLAQHMVQRAGKAPALLIYHSYPVFNMPFLLGLLTAVSEGGQLFADVDVLQSEGDPVQVPVRVDIRVLADHFPRHHGQGLDATYHQRGH